MLYLQHTSCLILLGELFNTKMGDKVKRGEFKVQAAVSAPKSTLC